MDIDLKLNRTESRSGLAAALVFIQWETLIQFLLLLQTPPPLLPSFTFPSSSFCTSLTYYEVLIWGTYETSTLDSIVNTHATLLNQHIPLRSIYIHISAKSWCDFCCENYKFMVKFIERTSSASCLSQHIFVVQLQTQINTCLDGNTNPNTHIAYSSVCICILLLMEVVRDGRGRRWRDLFCCWDTLPIGSAPPHFFHGGS